MNITGARVLVVGLGLSGFAALELLRGKCASLHATDVNPLETMAGAVERLASLGASFTLQDPSAFEGADLIIVSPGVPADLKELEAARERGVPVIGELELASYFLRGPVIGITGSNGKTTTTALAGHILHASGIPAQVGGNIGTPPAAMVDASRPWQWNVLELSSFQLETIVRFRAKVAVALNVTPDHLDRHHTMEAYAAAKRRLFETQRYGDFAVLNADDAVCVSYGALRARTVWFSGARKLESGLWLEDGRVAIEGETLIEASEVPLRGRHNLENVMAAAAVAQIAGATATSIREAIRTFPGVEHRLEFVRNLDGVDFYNDSKATNVDATLKALDAFDGGLWVILGGKDKGSDYGALRAPLKAKARAALLIGASSSKIDAHLGDAVEKIHCGALERAVQEAWGRAAAGDTVLLAPACASFDQFQNYEHRGRAFKEAVRKLEVRSCA
ncbi:MAG: UDP-N-acetylmuramoyl-L-alanine--D-glutamate ligase [Bryobacteraceae bacterium]|nr:UDP-N-acetylmuramoyl-L-alanine--D-glutamate ligase [Bryobacteraceae bacterium]